MKIVVTPYEVLVRFGCEVGEKAGAFRAASLSQRQYVVSDDGAITGKVARGAADFPADFPRDELAKLFGEQFEAFEAGHRALSGAHAVLVEENRSLIERVKDLETRALSAEENLAKMTVEFAVAKGP